LASRSTRAVHDREKERLVGVTEGKTQTEASGRQSSAASPSLGVKLLRVAWLAIALGIAMEGLLLLIGAGLGESLGLGAIAADLVGNVTWSVLVCCGLAVGTAVSKARVPVMGLLGLLAAPPAFEVSRVLHKGTLEALATTGGGHEALSPILLGVIKGVEYGCLGLAIAWVGQRPWGGAAAHVAVGLLVGLIFGGTIVVLTMGSTPPPTAADTLSVGVNEAIFPIGCSLILFSAGALGKRVGTGADPG
jgi:hypothetical protein